jgi:hypothetical protein
VLLATLLGGSALDVLSLICSHEMPAIEVRVFRHIPLAGEKTEDDEGMKFTDAQKASIIRQGEDGTPVEEICWKAGISQVM